MRIEGSCFYEYDKNHSRDFFVDYRPYIPFLQEEDDLILSAYLIPCIKKDPKII
tara:strand:- start:64 stop:225 length:162 start_codon:yes stop_codon:yes gene_type:complete